MNSQVRERDIKELAVAFARFKADPLRPAAFDLTIDEFIMLCNHPRWSRNLRPLSDGGTEMSGYLLHIIYS
jgi:hypothetical protein